MSVKLLTEQCLKIVSLKGGSTCSSEATLVKVSHCWKSRVTAHILSPYLRGIVLSGLATLRVTRSPAI